MRLSLTVLLSRPENYEASATLAVPPSSTPPPAVEAPAPPAAQPAEGRLTVKVPRLSARKLKKAKKFTVELTTTTPLMGVYGLLVTRSAAAGAEGRNVVASARIRVKK